MNCELCGQRVSVYSSGEGTNSYVGEDAKEVKRLREALEKIQELANQHKLPEHLDEKEDVVYLWCKEALSKEPK